MERSLKDIISRKAQAILLSIYNEYIIGYRDRSSLGENTYFQKLNLLWTAPMVLDGKIVGTWKRKIKTNYIEISLNLFIKLDSDGQVAFEKAVDRYGRFMNLLVTVIDS